MLYYLQLSGRWDGLYNSNIYSDTHTCTQTAIGATPTCPCTCVHYCIRVQVDHAGAHDVQVSTVCGLVLMSS